MTAVVACAAMAGCGDNRQPVYLDGGGDALPDGTPDGGPDAGDDAAADAPLDAAEDAPADAVSDAPGDAADAAMDGQVDGPVDGPTDGPSDAPSDGSVDGPLDAPADGPTDAAPDAPLPPIAQILINEVCLSPQHDFSGAVPAYIGAPGSGNITTDDEYIEFFNAGTETIDLTAWVVTIKDTETKPSRLGIDGVMAFSAGSSLSAFLPGGYLVLGNPIGASSTDSFITLHDQFGRLVDDLEIGGLSPLRDMEGDGVGDGAPSATANGFARGAFDEAIARLTGTPDTNNDINDFEAMYATPGRANLNPSFPPEFVAPTVVSHTTGSTRGISTPITINFSEPIDHLSVDAPGVITLEVNGTPWTLGPARFLNDDATVVLVPEGVFPFDATISVAIAGGPGGIRDLVGNPMIASDTFNIGTEDAPVEPSTIMIGEMCVSPLQDWSDSVGGNGIPFDAVPGTGIAGSDDEWIELVNLRPGTLNMNNYQLIVYTGPSLLQEARTVTRISATNTRVIGGGTLAAVAQGNRLVVGNPVGALPVNFFLELRDDAGVLLDHVEVGGAFSSTDRGGDGPNNGAPGVGKDGSSTSLADETISRLPDLTDTGSDLADWGSSPATIGAAN